MVEQMEVSSFLKESENKHTLILQLIRATDGHHTHHTETGHDPMGRSEQHHWDMKPMAGVSQCFQKTGGSTSLEQPPTAVTVLSIVMVSSLSAEANLW